MASEQEVIDARKRLDDKVDIESSLTDLSNIIAGSGVINIFIERDGIKFNLNRLLSVLDSRNANETIMSDAVEAAVITAIGPDEVTLGTIRKALRDLVAAHTADITAT